MESVLNKQTAQALTIPTAVERSYEPAQALTRPAAVERSFEPGEEVMVRDYRAGQDKWKPVVVKTKMGTKSYKVSVGSGLWKRHSDQIRKGHRDVQKYSESEARKEVLLKDDEITGPESPSIGKHDTTAEESGGETVPMLQENRPVESSSIPVPMSTSEESLIAVPNTIAEPSPRSHVPTINPQSEIHVPTINPQPEIHVPTINPQPEITTRYQM